MSNITKYGSGSSNDIIYTAKKNSVGNIAKGKAVCAVGFLDEYYLVEMAKADAFGTMPSIGIVETAISDVEMGSVLVSGILRDIDTSAWAIKDELYVSPDTAGDLTNIRPSGITNVIEKIGVVIESHASNGVIQVYNAGAAVRFYPPNNFVATVDPTANDDSSQGFQIGSRWINVTSNQEFVCVDDTIAAAIWKQTTV